MDRVSISSVLITVPTHDFVLCFHTWLEKDNWIIKKDQRYYISFSKHVSNYKICCLIEINILLQFFFIWGIKTSDICLLYYMLKFCLRINKMWSQAKTYEPIQTVTWFHNLNKVKCSFLWEGRMKYGFYHSNKNPLTESHVLESKFIFGRKTTFWCWN